MNRIAGWFEHRTAWLWLLMAALAVYASFYPIYYVGFFSDDATYILGAKSLLSGTYSALFQPGNPPLTIYPPGFPLFLAPFVALVEPHWEWLKVVVIALTLLNGVLAWMLYRFWLPPKLRLAALAVFVLNPSTAILSSAVMSEPLLITILLLSFLLLARVLSEKTTTWEPWLLGLLVGYATLIRSTGYILIPAIGAGLIYARRYRAALQVLGVALLVGGLFPLRNVLVAHRVSDYSDLWMSSLSEMRHPLPLLRSFNRVANSIFVRTLLALNLPYTLWAIVLNVVLALGVFAVIGMGYRSLNKSSGLVRALNVSAIVLIVAWFVIHGLWMATPRRYVYPLLPILSVFFVAGGRALFQHQARYRTLWVTLGLAVAGLYVWQDLAFPFIEARRNNPSERRPPLETWKAIRVHTPAQATFLTPKAAEFYLYTGHLSFEAQEAVDAKAFHKRLLVMGISHVLVRPVAVKTFGRDLNKAWWLNQLWTVSSPKAFKLLYRNQREDTAVYEVTGPA